jgi:hypothetical protein
MSLQQALSGNHSKRLVTSFSGAVILWLLMETITRSSYEPPDWTAIPWVPGFLVASILFPAGMHGGDAIKFDQTCAIVNGCLHGSIIYALLQRWNRRHGPAADA